MRAGKGFSLAELKAAGIRRKEALSIGIPVDHRRRNLSEEGLKINVDRLTAYKARLIVFPRNAKKPAKTDSKDLDAQVIRDVNAAIPIPAGTVAEAPRKIADAERETNAYRTLRNERATARYDGARRVRAAKKAEEEEAKLVVSLLLELFTNELSGKSKLNDSFLSRLYPYKTIQTIFLSVLVCLPLRF